MLFSGEICGSGGSGGANDLVGIYDTYEEAMNNVE